uniref:iron chelate uptake ABC transporter family permease subunit n=1 Tax=Haemophilus parahaemolyticus TaxID=735 RepID=UPI0028E45A09
MKTSRVLIISSLILLVSSLFFMLFNSNGNWDFILPFRGKKLLLLLTVAYTIGVSTLLFQTLTNNPILTPSILGFDSLYLLLQTVLVFLLGGLGFTQLPIANKFAFETLLMLGAALLLFRTL